MEMGGNREEGGERARARHSLKCMGEVSGGRRGGKERCGGAGGAGLGVGGGWQCVDEGGPEPPAHFCRGSCGVKLGERCRPLSPGLSAASLCPPQRHGLAVCLALTTMCTSLLLMYGGIGGGGGGHPEPRRRQQQQQVAAVPSRPPARGQHRPALPVGAGLLEGYISVLEHKVSRRRGARAFLVGSGAASASHGESRSRAAELAFLPAVLCSGCSAAWLLGCLLQPSVADPWPCVWPNGWASVGCWFSPPLPSRRYRFASGAECWGSPFSSIKEGLK